MGNKINSICFATLAASASFLAATVAFAATDAGQCGRAPYGSGYFGPHLNRASSRLSTVCKRISSVDAGKLQQLAGGCAKESGNAALNAPLKKLLERSNKLCSLGPRSAEEAAQLCRQYDAVKGKSEAELKRSVGSVNGQRSAFQKLGASQGLAAADIGQVAASSSQVSSRMARYLPPAREGKASYDEEISKGVAEFKAAAAKQKKAGAACRQLSRQVQQLSSIVQENLMPNLRVVQDGTDAIHSNARQTAQSLREASQENQATALRMRDDGASMGNRVNQATDTYEGKGVANGKAGKVSHVQPVMNQKNPAEIGSSYGIAPDQGRWVPPAEIRK